MREGLHLDYPQKCSQEEHVECIGKEAHNQPASILRLDYNIFLSAFASKKPLFKSDYQNKETQKDEI